MATPSTPEQRRAADDLDGEAATLERRAKTLRRMAGNVREGRDLAHGIGEP